jgi:hypothetical protein
MRHYQRLVPKAQQLLGECIPDTLLQKRDLAERCKRGYEDMEAVYGHFDQAFQAYAAAFHALQQDPEEQAIKDYEDLSDFRLDSSQTMTALRVRITRLDEEIHAEEGSTRSVSPLSHTNPSFPNGTVYRTAPPRTVACDTRGDQRLGFAYSPTSLPNSFGHIEGRSPHPREVPPPPISEPVNRDFGRPPQGDSFAVPPHDGPVGTPTDQFRPPPRYTQNDHSQAPSPAPLSDGAPYDASNGDQRGHPARAPSPTLQNNTVARDSANGGHSGFGGAGSMVRLASNQGHYGLGRGGFQPIQRVPGANEGYDRGFRRDYEGYDAGFQRDPVSNPDNISAGQLVQMLAQAINGNAARRQPTSTNVKLPKVSLGTFNGKHCEFQPWWDKFERLVDQNASLNNAERLSYLVSCLKDKASMLVKHLRVTNDNYPIAVNILKETFGNRVIAIETAESQLYDLKPVRKYDLQQLREFYFEMENFVGSLSALGADTERFVSLLLKKLPISIVTSLERTKGVDSEWNMALFRRALKQELDIRDAAARRASTDVNRDDRSGFKRSTAFNQRTTTESFASNSDTPRQASARYTSQRSQGSKPGKQWDRASAQPTQSPTTNCIYCNKRHWSSECTQFVTLDERKGVLKEQRRCFICLKSNHTAKQCKAAKRCFYCQEMQSHHTSLCPSRFQQPNARPSRSDNERAQNAESYPDTRDEDFKDLTLRGRQADEQVDSNLADDERTVMKTAMVSVQNPYDGQKEVQIRAFFDTGTSRSFITERMAKQLNLKVETERVLLIKRFAKPSEPPLVEVVKTVKLDLVNSQGQRWRVKVAVSKCAMEKMTKAAVPMDIQNKFPVGVRLADEMLPAHTVVMVDFMIGNDYYEDFLTGNRVDLGDGFWLVESLFGWMPSGRIPDDSDENAGKDVEGRFIEVVHNASECQLPIEDLWKLETIGIRDDPAQVQDDLAMQKFTETVRFDGERYEVTWPFNENVNRLPTNWTLAFRRLQGFLARAKAKGRWDFLERYDAIMKDQIAKSVLEESPQQCESGTVVHFLPHHGVETPLKDTTKLRVVYDASAKEGPTSPSLNECVYRGEVILEDIPTLLIRFRLWPIAIVSDIEKAFLQVGLQESQRNACQLLWVKNLRSPPEKNNLVTYRFRRVPFGVKTSPFLLGAVLKHHLKQESAPIARRIEQSLYVDNVILGVNNDLEAEQFYHQSKAIFRRAGMNLREYGTNSAKAVAIIPEADRIKGTVVKVLGIPWDTVTDVLRVKGPSDPMAEPVTRKSVLSYLFKVFDPLGLVIPVTVQGKVILQAITKQYKSWNAEVSGDHKKQWMTVADDLHRLESISVPRCIGEIGRKPDRIMVFCDASTVAYAAAVYLQYEVSKGKYRSDLVMAKARVAPIKTLSIPRLELLALLIAVRLLEFVRNCLSFSGETVVWSDSQCTLFWIQSSKVQTRFIENRLQEIRKAANVEFRYVPSKDNPADQASRGVPLDSVGDLWWHGPEWCSRSRSEWPDQTESMKLARSSENNGETAPQADESTEAHVTETELMAAPPIEVAKYSTFQRLVRVTAWCLRFIRNARLKRPRSNRRTHSEVSPPLQPDELNEATILHVKASQSQFYGELLATLKRNGKHPLKNTLGVQLDDQGLIRCHGRLANMDAEEGTRFPLLLNPKCRISELVIRGHHNQSFHAGVESTLASVRSQFWIPKGRSLVKRVIKNCNHCRKFDVGTFKRPPMPNLPAVRVKKSEAFEHIGLDNFGPLLTRSAPSEDVSKRWVTMFTCLATRAVHLELVKNQSAEEFLMAIRRFVARRGKPKSIVCDNATQFKAVRCADPFSKYLSGEEIKWYFIPQLSPWSGGVYERLIKVVKVTMNKAVGRRMLSDQELSTVLPEIEFVVNSRPITWLSDDINDGSPLSPNDLLGVRSVTVTHLPSQSDPDFTNQKMGTAEQLQALYRKQQRVSDEFWRMWQSQYLTSLREKSRWTHKDPKGSIDSVPQVDQVVLIKEPLLPRNRWRYGRIVRQIPSKDGAIRAVQVRTARGPIVRPVNLLCPLECAATEANHRKQNQNQQGVKSTPIIPEVKSRPRRKAAESARKMIKDILDYECSDNE